MAATPTDTQVAPADTPMEEDIVVVVVVVVDMGAVMVAEVVMVEADMAVGVTACPTSARV